MRPRKHIPLFVLLVIALMSQSAWTNPSRARDLAPLGQEEIEGPFVSEPVTPLSSVEVRSLPLASDEGQDIQAPPRQNPLQHEPDQGARGTWNRQGVPIDPLIQPADATGASSRASPPLLLSFDGTSNPTACGGCSPPDTVGDVGPSHYIQMVNATKVAIYDKAGTLLFGPVNLGTLWSSGNCTGNAGDPIVLYDPIAKRWLLSQFAFPTHMCFAISKTSDPLGAFWIYEFNVGSFPDYFKVGVWPDAYYMSANEATYTAYAFDRAKMLTGAAAAFQKFTGGTNLYLPSDLDGSRVPPSGSPNYFYTFKDNSFHGGNDRIEVRAFHVDWVTPANSTFTLINTLNIASFTYTVCGFFVFDCISQLGTAQKVDAVSEWPMHRFPYRNFASHQSLVGTFTVGGGSGEAGAAIRWFELRKTGVNWTLYQQGTFDAGGVHDRVMPSIAMDGLGNIALGYSVSSSAMRPAIRYTVHRTGDALGTMQTEATLIAGGGSQTGSNRWGDYSAMTVDPSDDISFWYTNEYYSANSASNWKTRVGKFKVATIASSRSVGANDGWVLESTETSQQGGSLDSTNFTFRLGDAAADKQFRAILHFNTSSLPDNAVIQKVVLKIKKHGFGVGTDPFTWTPNNRIAVDIRKGSFSNNVLLQLADFQAAASASSVGTFANNPVNNLYTATLNSASLAQVNKTGSTQFRLRFQIEDNDDNSNDYLTFLSGNDATVSTRPLLLVYYYVP